MTVYRLFRDKAFEPETLTMMTSVMAEVCQALGLQGYEDPQADTVAKAVIEFAQRGERDPIRLRESILRTLRHRPARSTRP